MSSAQIEQARAKMLEVGRRARQDPAFNDQLKANPVETLRAAGLNDGEISDYVREEGLEDDVSGYLRGDCACTRACCCTNCCNTQ